MQKQNNQACHSIPPSVAPALSTGAPKRRSISSTAQTYPRPAPVSLTPIEQLKLHPLAYLIPDMTPQEWEDFYRDVALAGIRVPLEVLADGTIVDGKHRLKAAKALGIKQIKTTPAPLYGDKPEVYMLKAAILRRNLSDDQRAAIATLWKNENKKQGERTDLTFSRRREKVAINTWNQAAKIFKVSNRKIDETSKLLNTHPNIFARVHKGELSLRDARQEIRQERRQEQINLILKHKPNESDNYKIIHGDFRNLFSSFHAQSIDAIITDPPYEKEAIPLYGSLAEASKYLLKQNGHLIVMTGQTYLPEIMATMAPIMNYQWMLAFLLTGNHSRQWHRRVFNNWKPIIWFVNGTYSGDLLDDLIKSPGEDKRFHDWQQTKAGFEHLIRLFTKYGDTILDPMMGTGTTGIAALRLGRKFIGIDIDEQAVAIARGRLSAEK